MKKPFAHKLSKTFLSITAAASCTLGLEVYSSAATLLDDNFDTYANQAAFNAVWPATVGTGGTLSSMLSVSTPNSINFAATPAALRNDRSFTETGTPSAMNVVRFSIDFFDTNAATAPYRQVSSLVDGTGGSAGQLISLGMNNNQSAADSGGNFYMARILGYTVAAGADANGGPVESGTLGGGAFFKLNDYGVGARSTGWHNLAVEITDAEFRFFVDGLLAETVANTVMLRSYDSIRLGSGITSTTATNFDNVSVATNPVPEPGTAVLGLAGGLTLLRRQRRRA